MNKAYGRKRYKRLLNDRDYNKLKRNKNKIELDYK